MIRTQLGPWEYQRQYQRQESKQSQFGGGEKMDKEHVKYVLLFFKRVQGLVLNQAAHLPKV